MSVEEQRYISLHGRTIEYTLRLSTRAKHLGLSVQPGARVVATLPERKSIRSMERFMQKHHQWLLNTIDDFLRAGNPVPAVGSRAEYHKHKEAARELIHRKLEQFNAHYDFSYNRVSIRNQKTRWGSCSAKGNLNFNYKLLFLPEELVDYVVVHELCHLQELNHSQKFWALVARTIPDVRRRKRELQHIYMHT